MEQEAESQDRDFEQNVSQMFWAQINIEAQLLRRDSNEALPKPTPTQSHQFLQRQNSPASSVGRAWDS